MAAEAKRVNHAPRCPATGVLLARVRNPRKAVCLLSGGLDSCVAATLAKCEGYEIHALSFDYGQRHGRELEAAAAVAKALRAREHRVLRLDPAGFAGSALTDGSIAVPKGRSAKQMREGIPSTYVPARNTVFLAHALAWAETLGADAIFIGANAVDYSGYPDCRPEYFEAFQALARLATKSGVEGRPVKVFAPLLSWSKARIIKEGRNLNAPLAKTWSCYEGGEVACGQCDSCLLRLKGFEEAGEKDPIPYAKQA